MELDNNGLAPGVTISHYRFNNHMPEKRNTFDAKYVVQERFDFEAFFLTCMLLAIPSLIVIATVGFGGFLAVGVLVLILYAIGKANDGTESNYRRRGFPY